MSEGTAAETRILQVPARPDKIHMHEIIKRTALAEREVATSARQWNEVQTTDHHHQDKSSGRHLYGWTPFLDHE